MLYELGQDEEKWAEAFCQIHPDNADKGLMLAWFANAIMNILDIERGTVINGEHAEYLLEKRRSKMNGGL